MKAARTARALAHRNTLMLRRVKLYFQRFPGTAGTDAERGIAGLAYTLRIDGRVAHTGTTAADGSLTLRVPAQSRAVLEILGTQYDLTLQNHLDAVTTMKGQQGRLAMLGYQPGALTGVNQRATDDAFSEFQADHNLDTTGGTDGNTETQLRTGAGE